MPASSCDSPPRDEIGRAIVRCAVNDIFGDQFLAVALERTTNGTTTAHLVGDGVPLMSRYRVMDMLCHDRAIRAELGALRVDGKRVQAEKYLAAWRAAPELEVAQFAAATGFAFAYQGEGRLADVADAKSTRSDDAVASFADFRARRSEQLTVSGDGERFTVTIPIHTAHDVALARTVHAFLTPWRREGEPRPDARGGFVLAPVAAPRACSLGASGAQSVA